MEAAMAEVRRVRLAVAGCGVVGGELVRALRARREEIERAHGVAFDVVSVLVRTAHEARATDLADLPLTTDADAFLSTGAEVVVEAIGGIDPALRIARCTLTRGAALITANKALIAQEGEALVALAARSGAALRYEATVAGGVPVIRTLRDYLPGRSVVRVRGILNGTCNFVLTCLENGASFADAVREAQRRGFAEADPSRDLDGRDAADKIAILAWLAFGGSPRDVPVLRRGILPHGDRLVRGAAALGGRLRLLACCEGGADGRVRASVEPAVVSPDSPFGRTVGEENRITIDAGWPWPLELAGPGAGGVPTAAALVADLVACATAARRAVPLESRATGAERGPDDASDDAACWLVGVGAGALRDARAALSAHGLASEPIGASAGDAWLVTGRSARAAIEHALSAPALGHTHTALARLEVPVALEPNAAHRTARPAATLSATA
jgi:homoserine dehydrogenase